MFLSGKVVECMEMVLVRKKPVFSSIYWSLYFVNFIAENEIRSPFSIIFPFYRGICDLRIVAKEFVGKKNLLES